MRAQGKHSVVIRNVALEGAEGHTVTVVHNTRSRAGCTDDGELTAVSDGEGDSLESIVVQTDGNHAAVMGTEDDLVIVRDDALRVGGTEKSKMIPIAAGLGTDGDPAVVVTLHVGVEVLEGDNLTIVKTVGHLKTSLLAREANEELLGSGENFDRASAILGGEQVAKLRLEGHTISNHHLARTTHNLELGVTCDDAGTRGDLARVADEEILAVGTHEGNLITVLHGSCDIQA